MAESEHRLFDRENLDALLGHLPQGTLSAHLVERLKDATDEEEARTRLEELIQSRFDEERKKLGAETPIT